METMTTSKSTTSQALRLVLACAMLIVAMLAAGMNSAEAMQRGEARTDKSTEEVDNRMAEGERGETAERGPLGPEFGPVKDWEPPPSGGGTLPVAAVAMGDSFISGEGAGDYQGIVDRDGTWQFHPTNWSLNNENAFFCHRSANASIEVADLDPNTPMQRLNIACSGSGPVSYDQNGNIEAAGGTNFRNVADQVDVLEDLAQTHDIDLVLIGLGSNNSHFSFGDVSACAAAFVVDGKVSDLTPVIINQHINLLGIPQQWKQDAKAFVAAALHDDPCTLSDLATPADFVGATNETVIGIRAILQTLQQHDADGQHRVVIQNYTNPLAETFDNKFLKQNGKSDTSGLFRHLVNERYVAGCPAHISSNVAGHQFSTRLGQVVRDAYDTIFDEFGTTPGLELVFLDVQDAFDGDRLCEQADSPANALAAPARLQNSDQGTLASIIELVKGNQLTPTGTHMQSLQGVKVVEAAVLGAVCDQHFQTCQETWHPNADGHEVLGECLTIAATTVERLVDCNRIGGQTDANEWTPGPPAPSLALSVSPNWQSDGNDGWELSANYSVTLNGAPWNTVNSTSVRLEAFGLPTQTKNTPTGGFQANDSCMSLPAKVMIQAELVLNNGTVLTSPQDSFKPPTSICF